MLPPPTLTFTIPSIHDDLDLQCRIYHPHSIAPTSVEQVTEWTPWNKKAAVVAHPYAPLGGCYDDPIVDLLAETIVKEGFCVGTFNFRGAGSSKGRNSWTSKAERNDYISFIGFMAYYMHHLSPPSMSTMPITQPKFDRSDSGLHDLTPVPSQALPPPRSTNSRDPFSDTNTPVIIVQTKDDNEDGSGIRLLLAGYSYGAMITASLPPMLSVIIVPFQNPPPGSPHAQIRLRAECLAAEQNEFIQSQTTSLFLSHHSRRGRSLHADDPLSSPKLRKSSGGVRIGGEEDIRASHDSYRSRNSLSLDTSERVRKSVDRVRSIAKSSRFSPRRENSHGSFVSYKSRGQGSDSSLDHKPQSNIANMKEKACKSIPGIGESLQPAYLLVSPLQGLINSLATMWSSRLGRTKNLIPENDMKLTVDPALVLFGDGDIFVSVKRLRSWAERLANTGNNSERHQFRYREVANAGHFWHDHEALSVLQEEVRAFSSNL